MARLATSTIQQHPQQCLASLELAIRCPVPSPAQQRASGAAAAPSRSARDQDALKIISTLWAGGGHSLLTAQLLGAAADDASHGLQASMASLVATCFKFTTRCFQTTAHLLPALLPGDSHLCARRPRACMASCGARAACTLPDRPCHRVPCCAVVRIAAALQLRATRQLHQLQEAARAAVRAAGVPDTSAVDASDAAGQLSVKARADILSKAIALLHGSTSLSVLVLNALGNVHACMSAAAACHQQQLGAVQTDLAAAAALVTGCSSSCKLLVAIAEQASPKAAADLSAVIETAGSGLVLQRELLSASAAAAPGQLLSQRVRQAAHLRDSLMAWSFMCETVCQNPRCSSLAGASEVQAASLRCTGCRQVVYCSAACQLAHWAQHKPHCGAAAAREEAAGLGARSQPGPQRELA